MSVTFGDNFANVGSASPIDSTTARIASRVASSECANTLPRASTLGHDRLTSIATSRCATAFNGRAAAAYSSALRPQIDAITRAPRASSAGRSRSIHASMPGPGKTDGVEHAAAGRFRDAQRRVPRPRERGDRLHGHRAEPASDRTAPRPRRRARRFPMRRRRGSGAGSARDRPRDRPARGRPATGRSRRASSRRLHRSSRSWLSR